MAGTLTLVGTPIGNLGDFSPRAVEALTQCDFIAAEDTRVTLKLLNHFGIQKPMVSYFEHNRRERGELICARILDGDPCCWVTDAGHFRSRRGSGGAVRSKGYCGDGCPRAYGDGHGIGAVGSAHRTLYL